MVHLFLAHFVADHGFTDNAKIRHYKGYKLIEHIIWSIFAFLAFTFDTLLKSTRGIVVLLTMIAIHVAGDIIRTKIQSDRMKLHILELSELVVALILNFLVADLFVYSYISKEFALYLLGMAVVTMAVTYVFKNFYPGDENYNDLDGISERLAFYVFFLGKSYWLAILSLALGFLYKFWKRERTNLYTWWISPLSAIVITVIWKMLIF
ncbi:hypothetical protein SAMN04488510_1031 [Fervidobacterium changbaicum]|uniref:DUF3307 domain-containing protein n=2 Tax=Fervidobacterium TaxID=2422 RepID=A0AAI8GD68_FERIS|nr:MULTISPECIES: hypothetical protein [Fervidobacterium]AMW32951.1 hypothetical protein NA23_06570 [Fervidobacterium islandicum]QAV32989.1 hypothetical protein CBS1_04075 [Fervidobacterium changbaicum]SDH00338.1 hypothetical protein SAMN04488510_1031 [Fervidobacterium changbaicum]